MIFSLVLAGNVRLLVIDEARKRCPRPREADVPTPEAKVPEALAKNENTF
jgi:hypothetical protein